MPYLDFLLFSLEKRTGIINLINFKILLYTVKPCYKAHVYKNLPLIVNIFTSPTLHNCYGKKKVLWHKL